MFASVVRRLRWHLGRRGAFLLIVGVGKVCWGVGFILEPQPHPQGLELLTDRYPLHWWAWLWIGAGLVMIVCAFLRIGRDALGFGVAFIPPAVWATAYLVAVVDGTYPRGGFVTVWYLTSHVGVIMWAATVPEHSVPAPPRRQRGSAA